MQVRVLAHLSRWMQEQDVFPEGLDEAELERFRCEHAARVASVRGAGMSLVLGHLRELGVVPAPAPRALTAADELLEQYRQYLMVERGLTAGTTRGYVDIVRPFVESRVTETGEATLWDLAPADVLGFLLAETRRRSRKSAKLLVSALRSLLGFWHVQGLIGRPLAGAVPSVAGWRLAGLPRALGSEQVAALLDSCDRSTVAGMRDFAILTMLVRLGTRRCEVACLRLDDIDWRAGELVVRGKGQRLERLPLPADVGDAIAVYLRDGRPPGFSGREVFVRIKAPRRPLTAAGVTQVVVSASKRAGLGEVTAHRLRHTAATELLRQGAPLHEIGELLRHRSVLTTAIYAKVDRDRLRELARPWPTGGAA
ncbi:MAG TPA: site-specific integrase [Solirubrobacteraceae bacterium]|nr:site-specific integrase [Solirubrobacteraceae bacterium]